MPDPSIRRRRWPVKRVALIFALILSVTALGVVWHARSSPPAVAEKRPNILMITLCSVRADRETPRIDEVGRSGFVFEHAWSTATFTLAAHASMFTGLLPGHVGVTDVADSMPSTFPTLPEILHLYGYHTVGFAPVASRGSFRSGNGTERGFVAFIEGANVESQRRFYAELDTRKGPYFVVAHFKDAHPPYGQMDASTDPRVVEWNRRNGSPHQRNEPSPNAWLATQMNEDPTLKAHVDARYDAAVRRTDDNVRDLLDNFSRRGLLSDTILVIVGDHGQALGEGYQLGHQGILADEVLHVPMVLSLPGGAPAGARIADDVSLVDLLPTLLELVGIPAPARQDGRSLVKLLTGGSLPPRPALAQAITRGSTTMWTGRDVLMSGPYRLRSEIATGTARLYKQEGGNQIDVTTTEPALAAQLAETGRALTAGSRITTERAQITQQEQETLRREGYW